MCEVKSLYNHDLLNDRWISSIIFPNLREGYFVEAGACAGKAGSACYFLEKELGWTGICVEPIPSLYETLKNVRTADTFNGCLYCQSDIELSFTTYIEPTKKGYSGITAVNKNLEVLEAEQSLEIKTKTITLQDLLLKFDAPKTIHYLALDTEGSELEILKEFNFSGKYKILAVSIEGHECDSLMIENGYIPVKNPYTTKTFEAYFVHNSIIKSVPQNILM